MIFLYVILAIFLIIPFINIKIVLIMHNNNAVLRINKIIKIKFPKKKNETEGKRRVISYRRILWIIKELYPDIRHLLSRVRIDYTFSLHFGFSDAAETAIAYGIINSVIYGIKPLLKNLFLEYEGRYLIIPDFKFNGVEYSLNLTAKVRLYHLLAAMFKLLKVFKNYKKNNFKEGGVLNA